MGVYSVAAGRQNGNPGSIGMMKGKANIPRRSSFAIQPMQPAAFAPLQTPDKSRMRRVDDGAEIVAEENEWSLRMNKSKPK
jgi:hypothetical protein